MVTPKTTYISTYISILPFSIAKGLSEQNVSGYGIFGPVPVARWHGHWYHYRCLHDCSPCLSFVSLRTECEADAIYSHGMTFLRTHRVLTALSQRPEYIAVALKQKLDHFLNQWLNFSTPLIAGTTFFFGYPDPKYMLLGLHDVADFLGHLMCVHARLQMVHHQLRDCKRRSSLANKLATDHYCCGCTSVYYISRTCFCAPWWGYNIRFEHTFIDEDQMKWAKRASA